MTGESDDDDGDEVTYSMAWTVDTATYSSALTTTWADDTVDGADTAGDEVWECTVTPNDGDDNGDTASDSVTITQSCSDGSVVLTSSGVDFVEICSGSFDMGCTAGQSSCDSDESPVMPVTLTRNYYMAQTETTQDQYESLMGSNPSYFTSCGTDCPVEQVTWHMAAAFANEMSADEGLTECYECTGSGSSASCDLAMEVYACEGYRLPTEAEWEGAARCDEDLLYAGSNTIGDVAWYSGNSSSTTHDVAGLDENPCGLYDMSGNVWEWNSDWYDSGYYSAGGRTNPVGASTGSGRLIRSGSYLHPRPSIGNRGYWALPTDTDIGIRLARTVDGDYDGDGYLLSEDCDDTDADAYDDNGSSEGCAALSCKDILDRGYSTGDSTYWIDPVGSGAFEVYCDMTTNDGGWTLIYSNYHAMGNSQHAGMFTSSSAADDQEYSTSDYTLSRARYEVGVSELMFKQDISDSGTGTTAVFSGSSASSVLDIAGGTEYSYEATYSDDYLPTGICSGMGTHDASTLYIGKTGSGDRDYFFSSYDTDSKNQAGYFCWNQYHCTNNFGSGSGHIGYLLFADCNAPDGLANDGYVEIFVRD